MYCTHFFPVIACYSHGRGSFVTPFAWFSAYLNAEQLLSFATPEVMFLDTSPNWTDQCWLISPLFVSLGVVQWNRHSKCQPSHHHGSPVFSVTIALQDVDYRFVRVNPCDLRSGQAQTRARAGETADLFHRGRDEVGQQGHCDPWKNFSGCSDSDVRSTHVCVWCWVQF